MYAGFAARLQREVQALCGGPTNQGNAVTVIAPPEREHLVWLGGSILTSLTTFQRMWVTREEYDESGPSVVGRKCY
jgi:actin-related protein